MLNIHDSRNITRFKPKNFENASPWSEKVRLPQNIKKLKWVLFRNVSLGDTMVFLPFFIAGCLVLWAQWVLWVKLAATLGFWSCGVVVNTTLHDEKLWCKLWLFMSFAVKRKKYFCGTEATSGKVLETNYKNVFCVQKTIFAVWRVQSWPNNTWGVKEQRAACGRLQKMLDVIGKTERISFYKVDEPRLTNKTYEKGATVKSGFVSNVYLFVSRPKTHGKPLGFEAVETTIKKAFCAERITLAKTRQVVNQQKTLSGLKKVVFKPNSVQEGKNTLRFWGIRKYPLVTNLFWLEELFATLGVKVLLNVKHVLKDQAVKLLTNGLHKSQTASAADLTEKGRLLSEGVQNTIKRNLFNVQNERLTLKEVNIIVATPWKYKAKKEKILVQFKKMKMKTGITLVPLTWLQYQSYRSFFPLGQDLNMKRHGVFFTTTDIASSYFLPSKGLEDQNGCFLGREVQKQAPFCLDIFFQNNERICNNGIVFGKTGSGKSFLMKQIIKHELLKKTRVVVLDPENEYGALAEMAGGHVVNLANEGAWLNPLATPDFFCEENQSTYLTEHLAFLKIFYEAAFPKVSEEVLQTMVKVTRKTYELQFELNANKKQWNHRKKLNFNTVLQTLGLFKVFNPNVRRQVKLCFQELCSGLMGQFFNKETNMGKSGPMLVINLHKIFQINHKNVTHLTLLLVMYHLEKLIAQQQKESASKNQRILIVIDEAHLLMDENKANTLRFLYTQAKRIRKYNGALLVGTQDIKDFFPGSKREKYTTGIVNNCQYFFYGQLEVANLNELHNMNWIVNGINSKITETLQSAPRGRFYVQVSKNERFFIDVCENRGNELFLKPRRRQP